MSDPDPSPAEKAAERALSLLETPLRLASATGARRRAAVIDLFRGEGQRFSDEQISLMRRMLLRIVTSIETELRERLKTDARLTGDVELCASLDSDQVAIAVPILDGGGYLRDPEIVGLLLRRSDEYLLLRKLSQSRLTANTTILADLVERPDDSLADAAKSLLRAEARSNDRFGDPHLALADLPRSAMARLTWLIAAALRDYGTTHHAPNTILFDAAIDEAGHAVLGEDAGEETVEASAQRLVDRLRAIGMLDDDVLFEAMAGGRLALYAAMLSARADIDGSSAWAMAIGGDAASHAVLLRASDVRPDLARPLIEAFAIAGVAMPTDSMDAVEAMAGYEHLTSEDAYAALHPWRLDSGYRQAIDRIGTPHSGYDR